MPASSPSPHWATRHDKDYWKKWFPADLISESFPGQFRNWFYSLLTMSTALENTEPFRANFTYATLMDEKGEEMHKSKGNAIEFEEGADKMGVDAMRWMYSGTNPRVQPLLRVRARRRDPPQAPHPPCGTSTPSSPPTPTSTAIHPTRPRLPSQSAPNSTAGSSPS